MQIVTSTSELDVLTARLSRGAYVTIDTEFMRDATYWPKLCLVQLAGEGTEAIVDPLADGIDLAPLLALLAETRVVKVFHAARQDIEIFFHLTGEIPAPVFDTQVAAMVCGFGDSVAYDTLARQLAGADIDKSSRFTDWSRRPLSEKQLTYALGDVTHLRTVYAELARRLEATGRADWLAEEMAVLTSPETYRLDPATAWKRLKLRSQNRRFLAIAAEVAAWREVEAQKRDLPRPRILKDEAITEVAASAPESVAELSQLRAVPRGIAEGRMGEAILKAVARAKALPKHELPEAGEPRARAEAPAHVVELLKVLLRIKAEAHGVAAKLIASSADLEKLALDDGAAIPALAGWRREIFGAEAIELKHGRLLLGLDEGRLFTAPRPR
ncbi:MAG: ribonuclease D [Alphaproteobacteria bacterium]|nr:ribonuclease D [Alphaproteobacteria bacterium]